MQRACLPRSWEACDFNRDGLFDVADTIYMFLFLFFEGPPPSHPFPVCGIVPGADCESFESCDD